MVRGGHEPWRRKKRPYYYNNNRKDKEGKLVSGAVCTLTNLKKPKIKTTNTRGKAAFKAVSYPKVVTFKVEVESGEVVFGEVNPSALIKVGAPPTLAAVYRN